MQAQPTMAIGLVSLIAIGIFLLLVVLILANARSTAGSSGLAGGFGFLLGIAVSGGVMLLLGLTFYWTVPMISHEFPATVMERHPPRPPHPQTPHNDSDRMESADAGDMEWEHSSPFGSDPTVQQAIPDRAATDGARDENGSVPAESIILETEASEAHSTDALADAPPVRVTETVYHDSGRTIQESSGQQIPNWAQDPRTRTQMGDRLDLVLMSGRFTSTGEAQDELWPQLQSEVARYIDPHSPAPVLASWEQAVRLGIVSKTLDVVRPLKVGEYTQEMHQLYWDVHLSPEMKRPLLVDRRPQVLDPRIAMLAIGLGVVTALFGLVGLIFRRRDIRQSTA